MRYAIIVIDGKDVSGVLPYHEAAEKYKTINSGGAVKSLEVLDTAYRHKLAPQVAEKKQSKKASA